MAHTDPRVMVVRFYKEEFISLLHTKIKALGLMISAKKAFVCFPIVSISELMTPSVRPQGMIGRIHV